MPTPERDEALATIFEETSGAGRTAGDASAIGVEALDRLAAALAHGHELGDADLSAEDRRRVDRDVRDTSLAAGQACLGAMRGLVISGEVDVVAPRIQDSGFDPLGGEWMTQGTSYLSAQTIVESQRERIQALETQPNQLYRPLMEAVAFAADLAGWTAWVDLT